MRKLFIFSFLLITGCATKSREPAMVVPSGALELSQALQQGMAPTLAQLRLQTSVLGFEGLNSKDPAAQLPASLKAEKTVQVVSKDKSQQQQFLKKFRNWSLTKKAHRGHQLLAEFDCGKAVESQALGFSLELDFPEAEASLVSQNLHEKVLTCPAFSKNESLFRLAVFAIQRGECPKAQEYLSMFPANAERGASDRLAYLHSLCSTSKEVSNRNPWGGYGILLDDEKKSEHIRPQWFLTTTSGSEDWDRLLVSFIELNEKGKTDTVKYLASKLNYEKFRSLPLSFQTSMMVLMSFSGADLSVFQTLHRYLADHPEMLSQSVAGLLFPVRYWKEIVENSKSADPVLVKALIRQESAFNPYARSRAKAAGLMQLIYPTARIFGVRQPKQLLNPEANIHAGSEFLARLINEFGSVELALAAYNAGPGVVRQWQKRYPTNNIDLFVEMIPYTETREYVRLVTRNYKVYQSILMKPQVLGDLR